MEEIIKHESQPRLKFDTPETLMLRKLVEENKSFDIMDANIRAVKLMNNKIKLISGVYCKTMGAYQYIHWTSDHPNSAKNGLQITEIKRRMTLCSEMEDKIYTLRDLAKKLKKCGHTKLAIKSTIKEYIKIDSKAERIKLMDGIKYKK